MCVGGLQLCDVEYVSSSRVELDEGTLYQR